MDRAHANILTFLFFGQALVRRKAVFGVNTFNIHILPIPTSNLISMLKMLDASALQNLSVLIDQAATKYSHIHTLLIN
jgi:hypothetical protein